MEEYRPIMAAAPDPALRSAAGNGRVQEVLQFLSDGANMDDTAVCIPLCFGVKRRWFRFCWSTERLCRSRTTAEIHRFILLALGNG